MNFDGPFENIDYHEVQIVIRHFYKYTLINIIFIIYHLYSRNGERIQIPVAGQPVVRGVLTTHSTQLPLSIGMLLPFHRIHLE